MLHGVVRATVTYHFVCCPSHPVSIIKLHSEWAKRKILLAGLQAEWQLFVVRAIS